MALQEEMNIATHSGATHDHTTRLNLPQRARALQPVLQQIDLSMQALHCPRPLMQQVNIATSADQWRWMASWTEYQDSTSLPHLQHRLPVDCLRQPNGKTVSLTCSSLPTQFRKLGGQQWSHLHPGLQTPAYVNMSLRTMTWIHVCGRSTKSSGTCHVGQCDSVAGGITASTSIQERRSISSLSQTRDDEAVGRSRSPG